MLVGFTEVGDLLIVFVNTDVDFVFCDGFVVVLDGEAEIN